MQKCRAIFIIGTTAVGKTKLSIELCRALNGQVINCDSKQLYRHADIMTAKADLAERQGIRHHMLDVLELSEASYNRNKYYEEATAAMRDAWARGKVPVVVGGTNYYLETLLYDMDVGGGDKSQGEDSQQKTEKKQQPLVEDNQKQKQQQPNSTDAKDPQAQSKPSLTKQSLASLSRAQKYACLQAYDPPMAQKLHPNDQTRVTSFLSRYLESGVPPSLRYKPHTHKLRLEDCVLFWIRNSDRQELHGLMADRIGKMVAGGGLAEALALFQYAGVHGVEGGVMQSIGYKEFREVYQAVRALLQTETIGKETLFPEILAHVESKMEQIRALLAQTKATSIRSNKQITSLQRCTQILTKNTIDYSRRQITWIKNRLFSQSQNRGNFFALQLSNPHDPSPLAHRFQTQVLARALRIYSTIQQQGLGSVLENQAEFVAAKHCDIRDWKKYRCEVCEVEVNGDHEWEEHLGSRRHRVRGRKKDRMRAIKEQKAGKGQGQVEKGEKEEKEAKEEKEGSNSGQNLQKDKQPQHEGSEQQQAQQKSSKNENKN